MNLWLYCCRRGIYLNYDPLDSVESVINCGQYVYHYTTLEKALEYILNNNTLRFSSFNQVNDPKESKTRGLGFILGNDEEEMLYKSEGRKMVLLANKIFENYNKLICFSCDDPKINKVKNEIKNFYRGCCRPRMWAQYSGNHKGVCLKFDKIALNQCIRESLDAKGLVMGNNVKYVNLSGDYEKAFQIDFCNVKKYGIVSYLLKYHFKKYKNELFFLKSLDWRDELEYRWVLVGQEEGHVEINFKNSLKDICVGVDFPSVYIPSLKYLNKKYNADLKRINWTNGRPIVLKFV